MMNKDKSKKTCFIMMPFTVKDYDKNKYTDSNHWNEVYEGLILPAAADANIRCIRDDKDYGSRLIMENILKKIEEVDIILCDLSSHNPNVFLELGWALRADKPFILIKDDLTPYNFDLNQYYTFSYNHSLFPIRLKNERSKLKNVFKSTISDKKNRFSVIKNLGLFYSAIKASETGDINTQLLMKIENQITNFVINKTIEPVNTSFPWTRILHKGNEILNALIQKLENNSMKDFSKLRDELKDIAIKTGSWSSNSYEFSIINGKREFVYHDKETLIGDKANYQGIEGQDIFDDVMKYDCGAVAWTDRVNNSEEYQIIQKRFSIAIFKKTISDMRIVVEIHHEIV